MHTDSAQVCLWDLTQKFMGDLTGRKRTEAIVKIGLEKLEPLLKKTYESLAVRFNVLENRIRMKIEGVCSNTFYIAKAKYAQHVDYNEGVYYTSPKLKIVGLDAIRASTPEIGRKMMKEIYEVIFTKGEKATQEYIEEKREWFRSLSVNDAAFPRGVNGLEKYSDHNGNPIKGAPGHVKAALAYNLLVDQHNLGTQYNKILSGDKMMYIHLKTPNPAHTDKIGFIGDFPKEFSLDKYIDRDTQFDKVFYTPISKLLAVIGWEAEKRNTIADMFDFED